jgi:hypothetical protein
MQIMQIHNLPAKHKAMLDTMWEGILSFIKSLPYKDMRDASYLIDLILLGGDEVTDVSTAKQILDNIQKL